MKRLLSLIVGFAVGFAGNAHADVLYRFDNTHPSGSDFSFVVPDLLTVTTSIPAADLFDVVTSPADETLESVDVVNPGDGAPQLQLNYPGGGSLISVLFFGWPGPFDHLGVFTHSTGSTLEISPVRVPEPSSLMLFGSGLSVVWLARRRSIEGRDAVADSVERDIHASTRVSSPARPRCAATDFRRAQPGLRV